MFQNTLRRTTSGTWIRGGGGVNELGGGGCERGWGSLEWGSRRANERGWKEALGTGLRARLRRREGGEKEANHPLTSLFRNDKLVGCH